MRSIQTCALILCVVISSSIGQDIQWASTVEFQYNQYDNELFSGKQALGPPDAFPLGQLSENAFRLKSESAYGKIKVGFNQPIPVSQLIIVENYLPGRIAKITATDMQGKEHLIFEPRQEIFNILYRIQTINIEKTDYDVVYISLHLNSIQNLGWTQIDAIGISEQPVDPGVVKKIETQGTKEHFENVKFAEKKTELSKSINSFSPELKPILAPNGRTIYFVRKFDLHNTGGTSDEQDIYYSEFVNGRWTEAQNLGAPLNDRLPNGICSISTDGNTVWVINGYNKDGTVEHGISQSNKVMGAWSGPIKLNIQDFYNLNDYQDYAMSDDEKTLLMAIERDDSYGHLDFYVSFNNETFWSAPLNLGSFINTPGVEYAPFLSPDTKTLFFSSNGYNANGDSDIYYCQRLDDTWLNWSSPKSVGPEINTNDWDSYFTMSPNSKNAYFVSSTEERGNSLLASTADNIYQIPLDLEPPEEVTIIYTGTIIDKNTKIPVRARMYYESKSAADLPDALKTSSLATNGGFNLSLEPGLNYDIKIEAPGYFDELSEVDLKTITKKEIIKKDFEMTPIKVGETFELSNIHFPQGKSTILPESKPSLEELIKIMTNNPALVIELQGHTDNFGSKNANIKLSLDRAEAIKTYLLANGVSENKVKTAGYGGSKPISSNATEETRKFNRRVEVKVLKL